MYCVLFSTFHKPDFGRPTAKPKYHDIMTPQVHAEENKVIEFPSQYRATCQYVNKSKNFNISSSKGVLSPNQITYLMAQLERDLAKMVQRQRDIGKPEDKIFASLMRSGPISEVPNYKFFIEENTTPLAKYEATLTYKDKSYTFSFKCFEGSLSTDEINRILLDLKKQIDKNIQRQRSEGKPEESIISMATLKGDGPVANIHCIMPEYHPNSEYNRSLLYKRKI